MAQMFRAGALAAALAATNVLPVSASASVPQAFTLSRYVPETAVADHWRGCRWRCGGWDRGWRRDRVDAGDVILGAAIIGGIAALISSENRRERDRDVVVYDRVPRPRDGEWVRRDDRRARPIGAPASGASSGLDNAVTLCLARVERDARVEAVEDVRRDASGWQVSGSLASGAPFSCRIGNDGQVSSVDYAVGAAGGQWSDDAYAAARGAVGGSVRPDMAVQEAEVRGGAVQVARSSAPGAMPAYPGGPIPGEEIPDNPPEPLRQP
jgi:hypothetical protein